LIKKPSNLRFPHRIFSTTTLLTLVAYLLTAWFLYLCGAPRSTLTRGFAAVILWLFIERAVIIIRGRTPISHVLYLRRFYDGQASNIERAVVSSLRWTTDVIALMPPPRTEGDASRERIGGLRINDYYLYRTVHDSDWKHSIRTLLSSARVAIIECGPSSQNFDWEIETVSRRLGASRIIIVAVRKEQLRAEEMARLIANYSLNSSTLPAIVLLRWCNPLLSLKMLSLLGQIAPLSRYERTLRIAKTILLAILLTLKRIVFLYGFLISGYLVGEYGFRAIYNVAHRLFVDVSKVGG
jgi:hypothetical protein